MKLIPALCKIKLIQELDDSFQDTPKYFLSIQLSSDSKGDEFNFLRILIRCTIKTVA